ncbi:MAG: hypothetical protein OXG64_00070 [Chloroflexi bacterium]|nr:hypothetical protein [Chloroflexota bacterium]
MPGEQAGQVSLAAAGITNVAAGDFARQVEQAVSQTRQETCKRTVAYKADVSLVVFVVAVHFSSVPSGPLTIDGAEPGSHISPPSIGPVA